MKYSVALFNIIWLFNYPNHYRQFSFIYSNNSQEENVNRIGVQLAQHSFFDLCLVRIINIWKLFSHYIFLRYLSLSFCTYGLGVFNFVLITAGSSLTYWIITISSCWSYLLCCSGLLILKYLSVCLFRLIISSINNNCFYNWCSHSQIKF